MALKQSGMEPKMHDCCRGRGPDFLGYLKPKRFSQAEEDDVRGYMQKLADGGKAMWQGIQAQEALRRFL